jgi:hypothetical protein
MDRDLAALNRLLVSEPPPEVDALVRERMLSALACARSDGAYPASAPGARAEGSPRREAPVAVPLPERCAYTVGLVLYGAQAAAIFARMVWRTFAG